MARKSVIKLTHIVSFFETYPKLVEKGENAVEAGHVKNLIYDGDWKRITADIEASMKDKAYSVQINFKSDGHIETARCDCPRGTVQCHHMAAALIYAHHNVSITDGICRWKFKRPAINSEVKTVEELFPSKKFRATVPVETDEVREEVYDKHIDQGAIVGFRWILGKEPPPESLLHPTMEDILFSSPAPTTWHILEKAKLSPQQIAAVEGETKGQSANWKWAKYRKFRLTASNFGSVIGAIRRNSFPPSLFKKLNGSYDLTRVKSVQWGIQNEKTAISVFESSLKRTVVKSGLWLDSTGLLGASPDGLLYDDDGSEVPL